MTRGAIVLFLLLMGVSAGAVQAAVADRILTSGPYTVRVRAGSFDAGGGRVRISRHGRPLVTLRERMITEAKILPLLGPHSADLVVKTFSGGAHYRTVLYIVHLGPRLRPLLTFSADNGDITEFKDLEHDGRPELIVWDDSFAYYDFSFAASPGLPFVFRYEDGRYRDATARFRWLVKQQQEAAKEKLLGDMTRPVFNASQPDAGADLQATWREEAIKSGAIVVYGDGQLRGRPRQAVAWLRERLPKEYWKWFAARRRVIRKTVEGRGGKISYRVREPREYRAYWVR